VKFDYLLPHWQEGMLLKPQHFQSLSKFLENRESSFFYASHPFYWGVRELKISTDEIANESISIRNGVIFMRDGLLISIPDEADPPVRNFKEALEQSEGALDVYLAIPQRQRSVPVIGDRGRYRLIQNECEDENSGTNPVMVDYRVLNAKILFGNERTQGYEIMPIARIRYSSQEGEVPELDPEFTPPCLDLTSSPILNDLVNDLIHMVDGKSRDLAQQLVNRKVSFGSDTSSDSESMLKLHVVNSNLPALRQIANMAGVHPYTFYQTLSRLVGELSIFTDKRRVPTLPSYDHDDPMTSLNGLVTMVREIWSGPDTRYFEVREFSKIDEGLTVDLDSSWMEQDLDFYVGVETPVDVNEVNKVMQTNIRMGDVGDMPNFKRYNVVGVARTHVKTTPPVLPQTDTLHYFKLEKKGNFWDSMKSKRNLTLGYLGESEELILSKLKTSETDLFKLYVILQTG